jgi:SAM-dependent methyltransferase
MSMISNPHYDASYFAWQCSGGELSAVLDRWEFEPFVGRDDVVLDFGCGGGYLLEALPCYARYGVEPNPEARKQALKAARVYSDLDELPQNIFFDTIISHHCLEHVDHPLNVLRKLRSRLKPGGKLVFVVPSESWQKQKAYQANDINQHLYTWTPLSLGNLFAQAGFIIERVDLLCHRWLPKAHKIYPFISLQAVRALCKFWGLVTRTRLVRIVASRPATDLRKSDHDVTVGHGI